jgi:hypothetical protein
VCVCVRDIERVLRGEEEEELQGAAPSPLSTIPPGNNKSRATAEIIKFLILITC